jgi:hypothetical protein
MSLQQADLGAQSLAKAVDGQDRNCKALRKPPIHSISRQRRSSRTRRKCQRRKMKSEPVIWEWEGKSIDLVMDWCGDGPTVLLLPALSSISTRHEMGPRDSRIFPCS